MQSQDYHIGIGHWAMIVVSWFVDVKAKVQCIEYDSGIELEEGMQEDRGSCKASTYDST